MSGVELVIGIIGLVGVIEPVRQGLVEVYRAACGVKIHQKRCEQLCHRYIELARTLQGDPAAEEGEPFVEDLITMLNQAEIQLSRWAKYGPVDNLRFKAEVKEGLSKLEKDVEMSISKFQIDVNLTNLCVLKKAHTTQEAQELHAKTCETILQAIRSLHNAPRSQDEHTAMTESPMALVDLDVVSLLQTVELNNSPLLPLRSELERGLRNELDGRSVSTAPGPSGPTICDPVVVRTPPARSLAVFPSTQPSKISWENNQSPPVIPPVKFGEDRRVETGTFNALIDKLLISASSVPQDLDFFDTFISTCSGFSSQNDVLQALYKRFHDAECDVMANQRVEVQLSVYEVLLTWIPNKRLPIEPAVLDRMKRLCSGRCSYGRSLTMKGRADATLAAIETRQNAALASGTPQLLTFPKSSGNDDTAEVAKAFTQRQALLFDEITPADWLDFLKSGDGSSVNVAVSTTLAVSRNITKWVTRSLLHHTLILARVETLFYFLDLARAFRDVGNFEGLAAVVNALRSPPIEGLTEMWMVCNKSSKRKKAVDELAKLVSPTPTIGYERYYRHINEKGIRISVPLLGAVMRQLGDVFQQGHRRTKQADRASQEIDFKQFDDFYRCAGDAQRGLRRDGLECSDEAARYMEKKLNQTEKWNLTMDDMMVKMKALQEGDLRNRKSRRQASLGCGFQV